MKSLRLFILFLALFLMNIACAPSSEQSETITDTTIQSVNCPDKEQRLKEQIEASTQSLFLANQCDFLDFETWTAFEVQGSSTTSDGHIGTHRKIYINKLPPPNSSIFPVGTIIVKVAPIEQQSRQQWEIHAMVKRGSSFNVQGAKGWEWYDLRFNKNDIPIIKWFGEEPPSGEGYGNLGKTEEKSAIGDCNSCHQSSRNNDYVQTPDLSLSKLTL